MKTEGWGNGGAVEIQGLTASKLLPQLTQDELLLCVLYPVKTPRKHMPECALGIESDPAPLKSTF
jgi:hypothetical protein